MGLADKMLVAGGGGVGGSDEQHTSSAINVFVTGGRKIMNVKVVLSLPTWYMAAKAARAASGCSNEHQWHFIKKLVLNAAKKLPQDVIAGFYTVEARNPKTGEKIGYDIQTFSGERAPLSRMRRGCGPKVGKYYFALEDFERVALPLLQPTKGIKLHIIDEVGRMELQSERFRDALTALLSSSQTAVFGSLRAPRFGHDLPFVEDIKQREDTATLTLTKSNRDATASKVEAILMNIVGSEPVAPPAVGEVRRRDQTEALPHTEYDTNEFDTSKFLNSHEEPQTKRTKIS